MSVRCPHFWPNEAIGKPVLDSTTRDQRGTLLRKLQCPRCGEVGSLNNALGRYGEVDNLHTGS